jgi:hypothetical protein
LYNNGDDCVLILDERNLHRLDDIERWFLQLGFSMQVEEPVYELEKVVFCQSQPIETGTGWLMVRQLNAITKDSLCLLDSSSVPSWMYAVGSGGLALAGDVPIYGALYRKYRDCGVKNKAERSLLLADSGFFRAARGMRRGDVVEDVTRCSFYRAFGVTPDLQLALEEEVGQLRREKYRTSPEDHQPGVSLPGNED